VISRANNRRMSRYTATAAVLAALAGALSSSTASAAVPDDPGKPAVPSAALRHSLPPGFSSVPEFREVLNGLRQGAARLSPAVDDLPGFTGIELSASQRSIIVHWQGTPPPEARRLMAGVRSQVPVVVKPARYSHRQLLAAARKVVDAERPVGSPIVRVAVPVDGHALEIGARNAPQQRSRATAAAGGVAVVVSEETPKAHFYGRPDDTPPFWGGARIVNQNQSTVCSTGFALRRNATGATAMLTAAHCGAVGNTYSNGTGSRVLGSVIERSVVPDTEVVSASASGMVYDGDAWSNSARRVSGTAPNFVGDYTCTLGGYSGTRCDVVVAGVGEFVSFGGSLIGPLVRAEQRQHSNAAGLGDSGGPVISLTGPDWTVLMANGTVTGGDLGNTEVGCTGEWLPNRACSWRIWYADVNQALIRHNATIIAG
jgi:hypothetical protein